MAEVTVNLLHEVCAVLVAAVYAPFQAQCLGGVYVRVAYDVLEVPLHRVDPAFCVQAVVYGVTRVWVLYRRVHVVRKVVVGYHFVED